MKHDNIGVCIIVLDKNKKKFILGKRLKGPKTGKLGLPGGKLELKEKLEFCAARELCEETSLKSKSILYVGVIRELEKDYNYIHFVFCCSEYYGSPITVEPDKCEDWKWYPLNNLPENMVPGHKAALEIYLNKTTTLKQI